MLTALTRSGAPQLEVERHFMERHLTSSISEVAVPAQQESVSRRGGKLSPRLGGMHSSLRSVTQPVRIDPCPAQ